MVDAMLMELDKIIHELHAERRQLDEAIGALEKLAATSAPRRGRPPKWLSALKSNAAAKMERTEVPKLVRKNRKPRQGE